MATCNFPDCPLTWAFQFPLGAMVEATAPVASTPNGQQGQHLTLVDPHHHIQPGITVGENLLFSVHFGGRLAEIAESKILLQIIPSAIGEHLKIFGA